MKTLHKEPKSSITAAVQASANTNKATVVEIVIIAAMLVILNVLVVYCCRRRARRDLHNEM
jgi:hypothetical protein